MKSYQEDKSKIAETSIVSKKSEILRATDESHKEMMDLMRGFFDDGKPRVGIFLYDYANNKLFGVQKDDADKDEFNLTNFDYLIDEHWNIGRGWSEDRF